MDISDLEKYDSQKMYKIYDKWPEIARKSFESKHKIENVDNINHIVFAGMGGSGAIGDLFSSILSKTNIHVNVVKGYVLPHTVNSKTLVIIVSVSGNTAETFTILKSAQKIGSKIISFTSGGKIQKYCIENGINHRIVPKFHSPRATFPSYLYTILKVLHQTLKIKQESIKESIIELEKTKNMISSLNLDDDNPSLDIAKWITSHPMIYYPFGLQSAAIRFKNSLQENAKQQSMTEDILEACHNGIIAWEKPSLVQPILIEGKDDFIKTKERWGIMREYFQMNKISFKEIFSIDGNILTKLINLIYVLDYSTIYKAVLLRIDPTPVGPINFVKNKLEF